MTVVRTDKSIKGQLVSFSKVIQNYIIDIFFCRCCDMFPGYLCLPKLYLEWSGVKLKIYTISNSSGVNCVTGLASGCAAANSAPPSLSSSPSELELSDDQRSRDSHCPRSKLDEIFICISSISKVCVVKLMR